MSVPIIHDWHDPYNDVCPQNIDAGNSCTCKRKINRKSYRVMRINDPTAANYQRDGRIILEVHPNGLLVLRERGRRKRYETTVGKIYTGLVWREAMTLAKAKKARKR